MASGLAGPAMVFMHGRASLLDLEEQGVVGVPAQQQEHPAMRSHTSDPDGLACEIPHLELLEQLRRSGDSDSR